MDKRQFQGKLFEQIFAALLLSFKTNQISMDTTAKILEVTGRLENKHARDYHFPDHDRHPQIFNLCSSLPRTEGWVDVVLATGRLLQPKRFWDHTCPEDPSWIYRTLETIGHSADDHEWLSRNASGVAGLFIALLYYHAPPAKKHVHLLLRALSIPGNISRYAAELLFQDNIRNWFQDDELVPILQNASLWASLMRVLPSFRGLAPDFIVLGHTLTCIPMWQPFIKEKLCSWIALFMYPDESWEVAEKYNSVLSQLWNPDPGEYVFIDESERALGLTFIALSNFWEDLNLIDSGAWDELVLMLRCTGWAVLRSSCDEFGDSVNLAPPFFTAFSGPLHDSLARAGAAMKNLDLTGNNTSNGSEVVGREALEHLAETMEDIANRMPRSVADAEKDWCELRFQFDKEMDILEDLLRGCFLDDE